jgi:hypothetical protein
MIDLVQLSQTVFMFLTVFDGQRLLTKLEQFGLLVAALCHDMEHPGNIFRVIAVWAGAYVRALWQV